ncbi:MAG: ATP-binding protein [Chitinophagales bacterium]
MIANVVDFFIPVKLKIKADPLRRARISVLVNFVGIAYSLISLFIFIAARFYAGIITAYSLLATLTAALILFRLGVSKYIIGNVVSVCLVVIMGIFCFYTGGISSPGIFLFALVPMIALLMVDRRNGMIWCFIASAAIFIFYILHLLNISTYQLNDRNAEGYIDLSTAIGFIFLLFFIIRLFQQSEKKALRVLGEKNRQLDQSYLELQNAQALLVQSEKMASLGQLTAGLAHEINNPINFISASISPLKRDIEEIMSLLERYTELEKGNVSDKVEEILLFRNKFDLSFTIQEIRSLIQGIEEGSNRTAEIVKGLRNFSRLDEEGMKLIDIHSGIESTLFLMSNKLREKNIETSILFGDLPEINAHKGQLNQVFMNLLTNAIDAIENNGKIFITTSSENKNVKIFIRDTGKGINAELIQKIFDPFFTTKEVGKGTGLGLSISYGIIEKHRGKIEVKSEVGKGTEFIIVLPIQHT